MWITQPRQLEERLHFLGTEHLCLYLLRGNISMLIGGGMAHIVPLLDEQLGRLSLDPNSVRYLVVPHSHFDHCGAVPYLRRKFPKAEVLGSHNCREVLQKRKVLEFIVEKNSEMLGKSGAIEELGTQGLKPGDIVVDRAISQDEVIDLGQGMQVQFIEVPGHSKCCLATYVAALGALFPSDAVPHPSGHNNELVYPSAQFDFGFYLGSLRKLASYDVRICALDHHGVFLDEQAHDLLQRGLQETERFRDYVLALYRSESGDVEAVVDRVSGEGMRRVDLGWLSPELMRMITKATVKSIVQGA